MRKSKPIRIVRESCSGSKYYAVNPLRLNANGDAKGSARLFCALMFHRLTGIKMKPGEDVQFQLVEVPAPRKPAKKTAKKRAKK